MKPLSYRQLKTALNELTEEQLDSSVTVIDTTNQEGYSVMDTIIFSELSPEIQDEMDLDENQPCLIL